MTQEDDSREKHEGEEGSQSRSNNGKLSKKGRLYFRPPNIKNKNSVRKFRLSTHGSSDRTEGPKTYVTNDLPLVLHQTGSFSENEFLEF